MSIYVLLGLEEYHSARLQQVISFRFSANRACSSTAATAAAIPATSGTAAGGAKAASSSSSGNKVPATAAAPSGPQTPAAAGAQFEVRLLAGALQSPRCAAAAECRARCRTMVDE